jgi:PAS domain S-box-containing protein
VSTRGASPDIEASPEATLVVDSQGIVRGANGAAVALLGYPRDELIGSPLDRLLPDRFRERHRAHLVRYFESPQPRHLPLGANLVALHRDGRELPLDIGLLPIETEAGARVLAVLRRHSPADVEKALRDRLDFEALVTDITARVVAAPPQEIDDALHDALDRFRRAVAADRAILFEYSEDWTIGMITHVAYGEGVPHSPERVDIRAMFPWADRRLRSGETLAIPDVSAMPPEAEVDRGHFLRLSTAALLIVPIFSKGGGFRHAIVADMAWKPRDWPVELEPRMRLLGQILVEAQRRSRHAIELARALSEVSALKDRLESENLYLRDVVGSKGSIEGIVATSPAMSAVVGLVERVAPTDSVVLLLGETGTGKEMLARAIHRLSGRRERLRVAVNCAALPASLVESELFGREKGAYTGALSRQAGRFELADRSTLFLDEVGELPLELQAKLLRVLETGEFERLGSPRTTRVDVRIVAATNRDLEAAVAAGTFRKDLYYRLSVFPIRIPPLRERPQDIPALVRGMASALGEKMGRRVERVPTPLLERLRRYSWPGNVRELRNLVERGLILSTGPSLDIPLPAEPAAEPAPTDVPGDLTLEEAERRHILRALESARGRIRGRGGAAERLGIHEATLRSRMKKLGIARPA